VWQALYDSLEIVLRPGFERMPPPDDAALDQFEHEHGTVLPASYREFIKVFGAGELGGFFRIKSPGYPAGGDAALAGFNQRMHTDEEADAAMAKQRVQRLRGMVYFASVSGGEVVAWDTADVRCDRPREYGVYLWSLDRQFLELAGCFELFITDVCLTTGLDPAWKRAGFVVEDPWPIHRVFVPEQRPKRRRTSSGQRNRGSA
jgi:hypothetical protein